MVLQYTHIWIQWMYSGIAWGTGWFEFNLRIKHQTFWLWYFFQWDIHRANLSKETCFYLQCHLKRNTFGLNSLENPLNPLKAFPSWKKGAIFSTEQTYLDLMDTNDLERSLSHRFNNIGHSPDAFCIIKPGSGVGIAGSPHGYRTTAARMKRCQKVGHLESSCLELIETSLFFYVRICGGWDDHGSWFFLNHGFLLFTWGDLEFCAHPHIIWIQLLSTQRLQHSPIEHGQVVFHM